MANDLLKKKLFATTLLAGVAGGLWTGAATAQDAPEEDDSVTVIEEVDEEDEARQERIVVTGSRLARDEFTSASPLKVLNIEESVQAGLVDTATIVQRTSVAGGSQTDNTFTGIVTDGGPGASTVSLRGLDAERTLILSNGRRLAPSGVAGSPTRPDLNLIPLGMVERVDILTDGASSIYGADAVAGVINFITRRDFDGIEFDAFYSSPEAGGGEEKRISIATGIQADRGFASFGFEYYTRDNVRRGERDFSPCIRDIEVNPDTGARREVCQQNSFSNQWLDPAQVLFGTLTDPLLGPDFDVLGFDFDNGSGFVRIPSENQPGSVGPQLGSIWLYDDRYNGNATSDRFDLAQGSDRYSFFTNGEYQVDAFGNGTFYYEGLYANRTASIFTGGSQVFPTVPCSNPFVQADPTLANSISCGTVAGFPNFGPGEPNDFLAGLIWLPRLINQAGPNEVDVSTSRGVFGLKGDLESLVPTGSVKFGGENFGINLGNLNYDMWGSFDHNVGLNRRDTFNEERLYASLVTARDDGNGNIVCGFDGFDQDLFGFISAEDCVPIDPTDPDIFINGTLSPEATDYVAGLSQTTTTIEQQMFQATVAGDLGYLPAGTVPFALGLEYRKDSIETLNSFNITAAAGTDGISEDNTIGSTSLLEAFGEIELPIFKGQQLAEELTINLSARWTEEENFGALWTYRVQGVYRPTDWITGRASFGTTYRAPNLREQFLAAQQSFAGAFIDPCIVSVFNTISNDASPEEIARLQNNCTLQGADVTSLGLGGATSIPVITGGTTRLNAETSESLTAGFVVEQPWFDNFDLDLAMTYFRIEIEDSVEEPNTGFILFECLRESTNLNSPFCNLIDRNSDPDPARNFISQIDTSFVNVGLIETDGVDVDIRYSQDFVIGGNELTLDSNLSASYIMSNKRDLFDTVESFDGRPYLPHWRGDFQTQLGYRDFTLNWNANYIGETVDDDIDGLRAADIIDPTGQIIPRVGDPSAVFAAGFRDVEETDEYMTHDLSLGYDADTWSVLVGVRNITDERPPLVDEGEGYFTSANVVLGGGYDVYGRSVFARFSKAF
ncbi:MAG: TonB-dependent receptor [Pseudomonadota bacterium]